MFEDTSVEMQEVAEPAEGVNDQTVAESETTEENTAETADEAASAVEENQTEEDNSKFAAARRKAEMQRDAEINKIKEQTKAEIDKAFADAGLINPYTNKQITTKAEYDDYKKRLDKDKTDRALKKSGLDKDILDKLISSHPDVVAARAEVEKAKQANAQAKLNEQIAEITKIDPDIKSADDLIKSPSYAQIIERVKKGYTIADAYQIVNIDAITQKRAAAARQQAINSANGKSHLTASTARGPGAVNVPADIAAQYRMLNPKITDEEMQKSYNKYLKDTGKR